MINFNDVVKDNIKENYPQIFDHPYRTLTSGSGKTNSFFNLIIQQTDIDKVIYTLKI